MSHATQTAGSVEFVNRQGFTLIDIAIVLAIIGLLVGGIVVGTSMIRNAEVQATISEANRYVQAIELFKDKYKYLPGDMPTAESFWGSDTSCPNTPYTATPHTATCNGNGDGRIGYISAIGDDHSHDYELFRAWQQLANAGLIEGSYNGIVGSAGAVAGINSPMSHLQGAMWTVGFEFAPDTAHATPIGTWPGMISHFLQLGSGSSGGGYVLTPMEAYTIDNKIDDGLPGMGNFRATPGFVNPNCSSTSDQTTATYVTTQTGVTCTIAWFMNF